MIQVVFTIVIHTLFVFVCSIAAGFFWNPPEILLLPGLRTGYLFTRGILIACEILPSVVLAGFLVACSVAFGKKSTKMLVRFSSAIISLFRRIVVIGLLSVLVLFCVQEILTPFLRSKQTAAEQKSEFYHEYVRLSEGSLQKGNYELAMIYIEQALGLYPGSSEAVLLRSQVELALASNPRSQKDENKPAQAGILEPISYSDPADVFELMVKAERAADVGDWLNAHYFAVCAERIAQPGSQPEADAKYLAADAWNHLAEPQRFENKEAERLFFEKQQGYTALLNGDYLEAYYIWTNLERMVPSDPDVQYFVSLAREYTDSQYFFIDETMNIRMYETLKNICFVIPSPDGCQYVVYIDGMSTIRDSGNLVQYLQNLSVTRFLSTGKIDYSFTVPYAKMLAYPLSNIRPENIKELGLSGNEKNVPYLMLDAISRDTGEIVSSPVYSVGDNDTVSNYIVMPVEYDDFILAASAYQGAAKMQLRDLISFAPRAELFGYSSEIYSAILINRLFAPLQILILFILLASVAWNYQLRGTSVFKLYYLFAFPLFTFVVYTADEFLRYLCVQFNLVCIGRLGIDLSFIVVGMLNVLLLFAASILFVSRKRSDC